VAGKEEQKQHLAHFSVQGTDHAGALNLDGPNTKLDIFSDDFLHLKDEEMACVRGVSKEGVSISAIYCVPLVMSGSASYHDKHKRYITLRPNYVVLGPGYLEPKENVITSISFTFSEANNIFYDWGTFGSIIWKHRLSFGQLREILRGVRNFPNTGGAEEILTSTIGGIAAPWLRLTATSERLRSGMRRVRGIPRRTGSTSIIVFE
jgi:hypothetical protein